MAKLAADQDNEMRKWNEQQHCHTTMQASSVQVCVTVGVIVLCACVLISLTTLTVCRNMRTDTYHQIEELRLKVDQLSAAPSAARVDQLAAHLPSTNDCEPQWQTVRSKRRFRRQTRSREQSADAHLLSPTHSTLKTVQFQMSLDEEAKTAETVTFDAIQWRSSAGGNQRSTVRHSCRDNVDCSTVTIRENGTYFIYAQLLYYNAKAHNSFCVTMAPPTGSQTTVLRCDVTLDYINFNITDAQRNARYKTCHTSGLTTLAANAVVSLENSYASHTVSTRESGSYWGLIKVASGHSRIGGHH